MVLARAERVALLHEGVALRYESVLEMSHHFQRAHSARQEEVGTHHGVLCGHGVLQLGFCKHEEGGVSEVIIDTLLYLPYPPPSPPQSSSLAY